MKHVLIAVAVSVLLSACGGSGPETATTPTLPPTSDEPAAAPAPAAEPAAPTAAEPAASPEAVIDRAVAMFIAAAKVVNAAAGDCPKMAADLNAWMDGNDTERNLVMDELGKIPEEERVAQFNDKMMQHRDVLQAMQQSVGECMGTPAFDAAWQRLDP